MLPILEKINEEGEYCPTIKDIRKWHGVLNAVVFDGVIPKFYDIKIQRIRNEFAWAIPFYDTEDETKKWCTLKIDTSFHSFKKFLIVLAHEMIHCWQWIVEGEMTHGKTFFQWREKLAEHEIPLYRGYHVNKDDKVVS